MNIETRFRIKPGGKFYTLAQLIVDAIHNPKKGLHAKVSCGYMRILTNGPLDPSIAKSIIELFISAEAGQTVDKLDILIGQ